MTLKIREDFLPLAKPHIGAEEIEIVNEVVKSGWWTTGPKVAEFEKALAEYLKEEDELYVIGLNSCTSALHLALLALGIGKDDEVIVPTWTFAATAQVVEWIGAKPILCDVDKKSLNIDIDSCEKLITSKTKAIMPVHIAGYPCDIEKIAEFAKKYDLKIIEDAAHAVGTKYKGKKIGNFGDVTCFSFYATKNLAMGEGGAAVTKDQNIAEKIRKLSYFGINKEAFKRYEKGGSWMYDIEELGYKCNLDSVHAALGIVQLAKLDSLNSRRRSIAKRYRENLHESVEFNADCEEHFHTYHLFPILLPKSVDRDIFSIKLKERNIGSSVHFIPLHLHSYYKSTFETEQLPNATEQYSKILSIPMYPGMSDEDVEYVIEHINNLLEEQ